ncbi:MAG TPA: CHASE3 domain-containing protein, partial [Candidatus Saccharimonadia bacterium]
MLPRELRQYSNRYLFIALGAITGLAFITTAATVVGLSALLIYRQGAQNYNDSRVELEMLVADIQRAASLEREHILTGNPNDLEAYRQQVTNLGHHLDAIEHYTATAETAAQARQLRPRVAGLLSEQDRILALYSSGDAAGATAAIDDGTETAYMSEVVSLADAIQRGDIAQLEADQRRINLLAKASRDVSLASLGITLLLAILVYYLYLKGIQSERRLDRAKDEFVSLASHQLRTPATGV